MKLIVSQVESLCVKMTVVPEQHNLYNFPLPF